MKKPAKVALIQPDSPFLSVSLSFPGLGLLYISSYLKQNGFPPEFYDLTGGRQLPADLKADIFGFSCQITQFIDVVAMMKVLKKNNPQAIFVAGGPFPTHSPEECLNAGFDAVVRGEGEVPMLEIVRQFPQVRKGEYAADRCIDPNQVLPDWQAIEPLRYLYQLEGKRCINIMTKRGNCPYHCTFCARPETGGSPLRFRTAENVIEEIVFLRNTYGFGSVAVYDDDVLINKKRDMQIFTELHKMNMPYRCMTRANLASYEDLKFLKETGCAEICIGAETGDPFILEKVIKKGTTIEQNTRFVTECRDLKLRVKVYLIIGLPSESRETVEKTKDWLRTAKPDNFDLSIFTPYPGSAIYQNKKDYEIDWDEKELKEIWFSGEAQYGRCAVSTPKLSSREIIELKKEIEAEFGRREGGTTDYWGPIRNT